jgi:hypothetical protein
MGVYPIETISFGELSVYGWFWYPSWIAIDIGIE